MSVPMNRTAIVLLASGLSRRYGRRDKMLANLGGKALIDHGAEAIMALDPMARVAVCPSDRPQIAERLMDRFVIAVNKKPKAGLGHSIAIGAQVALQFKPDAILVCMGDMPFIEPWLLTGVMEKLGGPGGADIVHSGASGRVHPPTAFGAACFEALRMLDGDDGAKAIIGQGGHKVVSFNAPSPLLLDVDTRLDLELAQRQLEIRERFERPDGRHAAPVDEVQIAPIDLGRRRAGAGEAAAG